MIDAVEVVEPCDAVVSCVNCSHVFRDLRDGGVIVRVSPRFRRDFPGFDVEKVLGCGVVYNRRLHKFEGRRGGGLLFRALIEGVHVVYAFIPDYVVFLRAFRNEESYGRFLSDEAAISECIESVF